MRLRSEPAWGRNVSYGVDNTMGEALVTRLDTVLSDVLCDLRAALDDSACKFDVDALQLMMRSSLGLPCGV